jgi:hypothetical protein
LLSDTKVTVACGPSPGPDCASAGAANRHETIPSRAAVHESRLKSNTGFPRFHQRPDIAWLRPNRHAIQVRGTRPIGYWREYRQSSSFARRFATACSHFDLAAIAYIINGQQ